MILEKTWTEFDIDLDRYVVHETTPQRARNILKDGLFSCSGSEGGGVRSIEFYEDLTQGRRGHLYFVKPKKYLIKEQREKGYRLDFGPHDGGGRFYSIGPLLRMDGTNAPLTDGCSLQARDSLLLFSSGEDGLGSLLPQTGGPPLCLEDLEDFPGSVFSAVCSFKAMLWAGHYRELRNTLRQGEPLTGENLEALVAHLPVEMRNMSGLRQNFGHLGLDPLQHSFIALQVFDASPALPELKALTLGGDATCDEVVRCAILYHDLGKKLEPFDPYHAELSGPMAEFHLRSMGYNEVETAVIKRLTETHDVMGRIKKGEISCLQGYHDLCHGLPESVSLDTLIKLHCEVAGADIASIPYLHGVTLDREREELLQIARAHMSP